MQHGFIQCEEARTLLEQGALLVDVRQPEEYLLGAAPGAINIPLPVISSALDQLRRDVPVLLYCVSGRRSALAQSLLHTHGFTDVHNVISTGWLRQCA